MLVESLSYNLLSIAQLANMGFATFFDVGIVVLLWSKSLNVAHVGHVKNGLYVIDFSKETTKAVTCLMAKVDMGWLWHCRLGHVNMRTLQSLHKGNTSKIMCVELALKERCMNFLMLARPSFCLRGS
jgi:hypothetical protein